METEKKKARGFESTKKKAIQRTKPSTRITIENTKAVEEELLDEVETELGENMFVSFL